ncbi:hypothetical protein CI109_100598 [Kwoniella shandongensis]|uniref:Uncharacterized protein n=1 Tax=Kwoniella shandongensis TaxID=1734106 RepID=A0A5M6C0H7_9TREE|nr:uncharacterized protein CI109_003480 [Kwoniella shandongensis]KAA5528191.1 hypothetical protein CI109_003480 [Kwoniella shandongensis]
MAKSIRSKAKMASRARKRQTSHYGITEAARTQRLSDKLLGKSKKEGEDATEETEEAAVEGEGEDAKMEETPKKISTSGPKDSGRIKWRLARGMPAKPKRGVMGGKNTRRR